MRHIKKSILLCTALLLLTGCAGTQSMGPSDNHICLAQNFKKQWGWCPVPRAAIGSKCQCECKTTSARNLGQSFPGEIISPAETDRHLPLQVCIY